MHPKPKMAPKMGEGDQIWLKCITGDLTMMIRDKNNIFERVENFHADWHGITQKVEFIAGEVCLN